jgi:hypothetical protein
VEKKEGKRIQEEGNGVDKSQISSEKMTSQDRRRMYQKKSRKPGLLPFYWVAADNWEFEKESKRVRRKSTLSIPRTFQDMARIELKMGKIDQKSNIQWNAARKVGRTIMEAPSSLSWLAELLV